MTTFYTDDLLCFSFISLTIVLKNAVYLNMSDLSEVDSLVFANAPADCSVPYAN